MVFDLLAVVADEIGGLLHVTERLEPVLADLQAHQRGELVRPLADQVGRRPEHGDPFRPGRPCPPPRRACRRPHGVLDVAGGGSVHVAQGERQVSGAGHGEQFATVARPPAHVRGDRGPQPAGRQPQPLLVRGVQFLVIGRQGCVGNAKMRRHICKSYCETFEIRKNQLSFAAVAGSMPACPAPLDDYPERSRGSTGTPRSAPAPTGRYTVEVAGSGAGAGDWY